MEYSEWNKAIFEYFFNDTSRNSDVLFSVDEYVIKKIGEKYHLYNAEQDFCGAVNKKTVVNRKNKSIFRLKDIGTDIVNGVPMQTSVIAFLILAASKMGEELISSKNDTKTEKEEDGVKKIHDRNYRTQLEKLLNNVNKLQKIEFKSLGNIFENDYEAYKKIFNSFAEYVKDNYNCKVDFKTLYEKSRNRKNNDWVGIPIFQSMISQKDHAILTQHFSENEHTLPFEEKTDFSTVFKVVEKIYPQLLQNRINMLFKNWDGKIYDFDDTRENPWTPKNLLCMLIYKRTNNGGFYITTELNKDFNEIQYSNKTLQGSYNKKYYEPIKIDVSEKNTQDNEYKIFTSESYSIKKSNNKTITHRPLCFDNKYKCIIFKKDENNDYVQVHTINKIQVGSKIAILANLEFFTNYKDKIQKLVPNNFDLNDNSEPLSDDEDLWIVYNLPVENYEETFVSFSSKGKYEYIGGLKDDVGNYIQGAEPILKITDSDLKINIDGKLEKNKIINLSKKYNDINQKHNVTIANNNRELTSYTIVDIKNAQFNKTDKELNIYNVINGKILHKKTNYNGENMTIHGALLQNFPDKIINTRKIYHICTIVSELKNEQKLLMPSDIKKEILENFPQSNKSYFEMMRKYFEENLYIDDVILRYLNEMKKFL